MNIKKILASVVAGSLMITSSVSFISEINAADSSQEVLVSLEEHDTRLTVVEKEKGEFNGGVALGTILDNMVNNDDEWDSETGEWVYKPVEIAEDAKLVWIGDNEYSVYSDREQKIYLSTYGTNDIIVGSGKQLDKGNVIYHLYYSIQYLVYSVDWENSDIRFYNVLEDGTEKEFNDFEIDSSYSDTVYFESKNKAPIGTITADLANLKFSANNDVVLPEHYFKIYDYYTDEEITADENGRIIIDFGSGSSKSFIIKVFDKSSDEEIFSMDSAYISLSYPSIYYFGSFRDKEYTITRKQSMGNNTYTVEDNFVFEPKNELDGAKYRISSFYNRTNSDFYSDVLISVKGNYESIADIPEDAEDITEDLFSYYGGIEGDYANGQEFTIFLDAASDNVKPFCTDDAEEFAAHIKVTAEETRYTDTLDLRGTKVYDENSAIDLYSFSSSTSGNIYSRDYSISAPIDEKDTKIGFYIYKLERWYDEVELWDCVSKAVKGKYSSSEEAKDAEEISTADLFDSSKGYVSDFNAEGGEDITIFLDAAGDSPANALCVSAEDTEYVINLHFSKYIYEPSPDVPDPEPEPEPEYDLDDSIPDDELEPDIENTNFKVTSVYTKDEEGYSHRPDISLPIHGNSSSTYFDSYGKYGTQTILIKENEYSPIDLSNIYLNVSTSSDIRVFVVDDNGQTKYVDLNKEPQDFSDGKAKHYITAKHKEGNTYYKQGNYYVSVKKINDEEGGLFVEGPTEQNGLQNGTRTVFFDYYYGSAYHDIIIANLGTADITNLKAELKDAENVKLNGYWNLNEPSTLEPTKLDTGRNSSGYYTVIDNMAKIRLEPERDENGYIKQGDIKGKLIITADGQTAYTINLSGKISDPEITNSELDDNAVKYVPYSSVVNVDVIHKWLKTTFKIARGALPEGLELDRYNGEIYGAPLESGTFNFTVEAVTVWEGHEDEYNPHYSYKDFTLEVKDNTDENVFKATDEGRSIISEAVGEEEHSGFVGTKGEGEYEYIIKVEDREKDQYFITESPFNEFKDFWLNGVRLERDVDYSAEEGSTVITIFSQTISGNCKEGSSNTIANSYRKDGEDSGELTRTAQNFVYEKEEPVVTEPETEPEVTTPKTEQDPSVTGGTDEPAPIVTGGNNESSVPENTAPAEVFPEDTAPVNTDTANKTVYTPEPVGADVDSTAANIIKTFEIFSPEGALPNDAKLIITPDLSIPADKGIGFDIKFMLNGEAVQPKEAVIVTLAVPETLKNKTVYVYHIEDGKYVHINSEIRDNKIYFNASHFSTYVISEHKLSSDGNIIADSASNTGTDGNMNTGMSISAVGMVISGAALAALWLGRKKNK